MPIERYKNENYGSLIKIEYAPVWQISTFLLAGKGKVSPLTFLPGFGWQQVYCSVDTMGHRQPLAVDNNGEVWQQQVTGFIPGDENEIEEGLQALPGQRYLVRITRPNGIVKIIGTLDCPLDLKIDSDSQTTVPGTAGTSIQFSGNTNNRALREVL